MSKKSLYKRDKTHLNAARPLLVLHGSRVCLDEYECVTIERLQVNEKLKFDVKGSISWSLLCHVNKVKLKNFQ